MGMKEFFGINSPSIVMRDKVQNEVNKYIIQGIADGVKCKSAISCEVPSYSANNRDVKRYPDTIYL